MKIGVLYGVHGGDEQFAVDFGHSLEDDPIEDVYPMPGNIRAIEAGGDTRFIDENLAYSFRYPDPESPIYERRRAAEIITWCMEEKFGLIVDIHAAPYDAGLYAAVGLGTTTATIKAAQFLGRDMIVVEDTNLHCQVPNSVIIECSPQGIANSQRQIRDLRCDLGELAKYPSMRAFDRDYLPLRHASIWLYGDAIKTNGVDLRTAMEMGYADRPFASIEAGDAAALGVPTVPGTTLIDPHVMSFGGKYADKGYLGEYIYPIGKTSDPNWRAIARSLHAKEMVRTANRTVDVS